MSNLTPRINNIQSNQNIIINGGLDFWQRGTSSTLTTQGNVYLTADRFRTDLVNNTVNNAFTQSRQTLAGSDLPKIDAGINYSIKNEFTSTPDAGSYLLFDYAVEGYDLASLVGKKVVVSFYVKSNVTGAHTFYLLQTGSPTRFYYIEYNIDQADTWQRVTATIQMETSDQTTHTTDENVGLRLRWTLKYGSLPVSATTGSWVSSDGIATAASQQIDSAGDYMEITGIMLHEGETAGKFKRAGKTIGEELSYCQRYYERENSFDGNSGFLIADITSGIDYYISLGYATHKRAAATITILNSNSVGFGAPTAFSDSVGGFRFVATASSTIAYGYYRNTWAADAEL